MLSIIINLLTAIFVLVAILLVLVVLMQRPKSQGLGAAFGGGMTESMFGAHTSSVLSRFTVILAMCFFALTLTLAILHAQRSEGDSEVLQRLLLDYEADDAEAETEEVEEPVEVIIEDVFEMDEETVEEESEETTTPETEDAVDPVEESVEEIRE